MQASHSFNSENWWVVPISRSANAFSDEFNRSLANIILKKEREILAKGTSTRVAGLDDGLTAHWMEYNVLNWDFDECRQLAEVVEAGFEAFLDAAGLKGKPGMEIAGISCWANILRPGQALQVHHHDPAFASAHYTVTTGLDDGVELEAADSGETVYFRPGFSDRSHGGKQNGFVSPWDDDWRLCRKPTAGYLTFFPSYIRHEVRPNVGRTERISIALDIFTKSQEAMIYFGGPRWYVPK